MNKKIFFCSLVLFISILFTPADAISQKRKILNDSIGLVAYGIAKGDTAIITYDSAFVVNRKLYHSLKNTYEKVRRGNTNSAINQLFALYDSIINFQDSMIKVRDEHYNALKLSFDNLAQSTNSFVDRTDQNVAAINQSITIATNQVNNIKTLLTSSIDQLKLQQKQKFKLVLGGFTVGVGVATLIFLIAK